MAQANDWLHKVSTLKTVAVPAVSLSSMTPLPLQSDAHQLADFVTAAEILETIGNLLEASGKAEHTRLDA